jgi:hypothetical protein
MRSFSSLVCCTIFLTLVVVLSIARIEYLNAMGGHVLPRHAVQGVSQSLDLPPVEDVVQNLGNQFRERRRIELAYGSDEPEDPDQPAQEISTGPPYSTAEKRSIKAVLFQHDVLTELRWSMQVFGLAQHLLAPLALILAVCCWLGGKGNSSKALAIVCGSLSCIAMFMIFIRDYWNALG